MTYYEPEAPSEDVRDSRVFAVSDAILRVLVPALCIASVLIVVLNQFLGR